MDSGTHKIILLFVTGCMTLSFGTIMYKAVNPGVGPGIVVLRPELANASLPDSGEAKSSLEDSGKDIGSGALSPETSKPNMETLESEKRAEAHVLMKILVQHAHKVNPNLAGRKWSNSSEVPKDEIRHRFPVSGTIDMSNSTVSEAETTVEGDRPSTPNNAQTTFRETLMDKNRIVRLSEEVTAEGNEVPVPESDADIKTVELTADLESIRVPGGLNYSESQIETGNYAGKQYIKNKQPVFQAIIFCMSLILCLVVSCVICAD